MLGERAIAEEPDPHRRREGGLCGFQDEGDGGGEGGELALEEEDEEDYDGEEAVDGVGAGGVRCG